MRILSFLFFLLLVIGFGRALPVAAIVVAGQGETCTPVSQKPNELIAAYQNINSGIVVLSSTCQTYKFCDEHAPMVDLKKSEPVKGYIHQMALSGCDTNALGGHQTGQLDYNTQLGCCIYYGVPEPPKETPVLSAGSSMKIDNPLGAKSILEVIQRVVQTFVSILGVLALLVFVYAGVVWMTAGGDASRAQHAQATMRYAVIGLGLIIFSYVLINFAFRAVVGV